MKAIPDTIILIIRGELANRGMDAPAKPALCGVTRSKSKGFGSEGEFTSPQRGKKFARTANFWTRTKGNDR